MITRHNPDMYTDVNPSPTGKMVFVNDIMDYLKEKRSEFLNDNDATRRWVIEDLMKQLGEFKG